MGWKKLIYSGSNAHLNAITSSAYQGITKNIGITVDGGGSVITSGIKGDLFLTETLNVEHWYIMSTDVGSVTFDVWYTDSGSFPPTAASSIIGDGAPTLDSQNFAASGALNWTNTMLVKDRTVRFYVNPTPSTITKCTLILKCKTV